MKTTATVVWVHNAHRLSLSSLRALPKPPLQKNRYLIVSIPRYRDKTKTTPRFGRPTQDITQQTRVKMHEIAECWCVPKRHCWLDRSLLSPQAVTRRLRQPAHFVHIGRSVFLSDLKKAWQMLSSALKKMMRMMCPRASSVKCK